MKRAFALLFFALAVPTFAPAQIQKWTIKLEEPTGIERRDQEIVRIGLNLNLNQRRAEALRLIDSQGRELPLQVITSAVRANGVTAAEMLFPATMIPGELPVYTLIYAPQLASKKLTNERGGEYVSDIVARRIATSRF